LVHQALGLPRGLGVLQRYGTSEPSRVQLRTHALQRDERDAWAVPVRDQGGLPSNSGRWRGQRLSSVGLRRVFISAQGRAPLRVSLTPGGIGIQAATSP